MILDLELDLDFEDEGSDEGLRALLEVLVGLEALDGAIVRSGMRKGLCPVTECCVGQLTVSARDCCRESSKTSFA